ncbi:hypothetical protein HELRODRAFT_172033 [Helobdella robusta]|uniref:Uncharacterized protein n=1 Tax=Helobdella robusta TaxID=6412 RepID=T1F4Y9_HELRO|nr:hypothetical protein HELRODRAFT_172033 [Helobdella robusta]ESO05020.1 hypothetical protein HELRODRAFT_172033 [Helobdella robusta]
MENEVTETRKKMLQFMENMDSIMKNDSDNGKKSDDDEGANPATAAASTTNADAAATNATNEVDIEKFPKAETKIFFESEFDKSMYQTEAREDDRMPGSLETNWMLDNNGTYSEYDVRSSATKTVRSLNSKWFDTVSQGTPSLEARSIDNKSADPSPLKITGDDIDYDEDEENDGEGNSSRNDIISSESSQLAKIADEIIEDVLVRALYNCYQNTPVEVRFVFESCRTVNRPGQFLFSQKLLDSGSRVKIKVVKDFLQGTVESVQEWVRDQFKNLEGTRNSDPMNGIDAQSNQHKFIKEDDVATTATSVANTAADTEIDKKVKHKDELEEEEDDGVSQSYGSLNRPLLKPFDLESVWSEGNDDAVPVSAENILDELAGSEKAGFQKWLDSYAIELAERGTNDALHFIQNNIYTLDPRVVHQKSLCDLDHDIDLPCQTVPKTTKPLSKDSDYEPIQGFQWPGNRIFNMSIGVQSGRLFKFEVVWYEATRRQPIPARTVSVFFEIFRKEIEKHEMLGWQRMYHRPGNT